MKPVYRGLARLVCLRKPGIPGSGDVEKFAQTRYTGVWRRFKGCEIPAPGVQRVKFDCSPFNNNFGYYIFADMISDYNLICCDKYVSNGNHTYQHDSLGHYSWLDHFLFKLICKVLCKALKY